jgi:hypothetical protein
MQFNFQSRACSSLDPAHRTVHKRFEFLDPIEDSLDLHPAPFALANGEFALPSDQQSERGAPLFNNPAFYPQIPRKSRILLMSHQKYGRFQ